MSKLENQKAIVTGSGRGLGIEIARRFVRDGADVMITDIIDEGLEELSKELADEGPGEVKWAVADLSQKEGAAHLIEESLKGWGQIDILVNNAGGGVIRPFLSHDEESLKATIDRNLWTCIWCCQMVLPHMVERNYGRIVNIGADSVRNGLDSHAAYNAAKGGMHGITSGLGREFAKQGITVNTIAPPGILTPEIKKMLDPDSEVYGKHMIKNINDLVNMIPAGRFCEMEEVASMASYLASPEAGFVTGQIISVNGGSTML